MTITHHVIGELVNTRGIKADNKFTKSKYIKGVLVGEIPIKDAIKPYVHLERKAGELNTVVPTETKNGHLFVDAEKMSPQVERAKTLAKATKAIKDVAKKAANKALSEKMKGEYDEKNKSPSPKAAEKVKDEILTSQTKDLFTASEFSKDLDHDILRKAFYFNSFDPDRKAKHETNMYGVLLESDYNMLKNKAVTPELLKELETDFEAYRQGYKKKYLEWVRAEGKTLNMAVTGPSGLNSQLNRKKQSIADDLYSELTEYRNQSLKKLKQKMTDTAPIKSGQFDAIEKIQKKIEGLQASNELFKKYNTVLRKTKGQPVDDRVKALIDAGVTELAAKAIFNSDIKKLDGEPWGWSTDSNNAEIRRYKQRIKDIESANEKANQLKAEQAKNRENFASNSNDNANVLGYEKGKHSKTGEDLHISKLMGDRIDKETFAEHKAKAKALGGYYSSYVKGFVMPDETAAKSFAKHINT